MNRGLIFTSPLVGEVGARSAPGEGVSSNNSHLVSVQFERLSI